MKMSDRIYTKQRAILLNAYFYIYNYVEMRKFINYFDKITDQLDQYEYLELYKYIINNMFIYLRELFKIIKTKYKCILKDHSIKINYLFNKEKFNSYISYKIHCCNYGNAQQTALMDIESGYEDIFIKITEFYFNKIDIERDCNIIYEYMFKKYCIPQFNRSILVNKTILNLKKKYNF